MPPLIDRVQPPPFRVALLDASGQLVETWRRFFLTSQVALTQILAAKPSSLAGTQQISIDDSNSFDDVFPPLTGGFSGVATFSGVIDDNTTNAAMYLVWVPATPGNEQLETSSTKLIWIPSSGQLGVNIVNAVITGPQAGTFDGGIRVRNPATPRYRADFNVVSSSGAGLNAFDDIAVAYLPFAMDANPLKFNTGTLALATFGGPATVNGILTEGGLLALGIISTDGIVIENDTLSTAGVPIQQSPRLRLRAHVWNTTAVATDNTNDWWIESVPISAAVPKGLLKFGSSLNGATATFPVQFTSAGAVLVGDGAAANPSFALASAVNTGFYKRDSATLIFSSAGGASLALGGGTVGLISNGVFCWTNSAADPSTTKDLNLTRGGGPGLLNIAATVNGIGFDVTTDALLKIRTRAQTGDASLSALNITTSGTLIDKSYNIAVPVTLGTVTMSANQQRQIINPAGTLAVLTVTLPPTPTDGQIAGISFAQAITGLTINAPGGATVVGPPVSAAINSEFQFLYQASSTSWFPAA